VHEAGELFVSFSSTQSNTAMAARVVAPSILAVGSGAAAFATSFPSKKGASLLVSKRFRISAQLGT
jgi:hypothetical protein